MYLNIAEFGPHLYGIEAAAQRYYSISAADLTLADAISIACCLPNPLHRDPDWVNRYLSSRRAEIAASAQHVKIQ